MAMFMKMLPMSVSKHITSDSWSSLLFFAKLVYMDNRRVDLKAKAFIIEHGDGAADDHIGEFANGFARYLYTVSRSGGSAPGGHVVRGADSQSRTCDQGAQSCGGSVLSRGRLCDGGEAFSGGEGVVSGREGCDLLVRPPERSPEPEH